MNTRKFSVLAALACSAFCAPTTSITPQAQSVCDEIYVSAPSHLAYGPSSSKVSLNSQNMTALYEKTQTTYWNAANDEDVPACIFFPPSAQDVSAAIIALKKPPGVPFALKSGGCTFNRGYSSTNGGVLISFRPDLQGTELGEDGQTAKVGPGSRWGEVMTTLDSSNKAMVGGRVADVAKCGFACGDVVEYELVTANGTILTANAATSSEIFWALHGGGNAFGVVTMYTLKTHDINDVWGGTITYDATQHPDIMIALTNFVAKNQDPRAAIVPEVGFISGNQSLIVNIDFFYDGPDPPSDVFSAFTSLPKISDTTKTQRYAQLLVNEEATSALGVRWTHAVNSFPNLSFDNMTSFLDGHWDLILQAPFINSIQELGIEVFSMTLQPVSVGLQQASRSQGSGALSLDPANSDKIWVEYDLGWKNATCDDYCPNAVKKLVDQALAYQKRNHGGIEPTHYVSGNLSFVPYNPLFLNDAQNTQDIFGSHGQESYMRFKTLYQELDPAHFMVSRQNGRFFQYGNDGNMKL